MPFTDSTLNFPLFKQVVPFVVDKSITNIGGFKCRFGDGILYVYCTKDKQIAEFKFHKTSYEYMTVEKSVPDIDKLIIKMSSYKQSC
jgi:hypothetical protein